MKRLRMAKIWEYSRPFKKRRISHCVPGIVVTAALLMVAASLLMVTASLAHDSGTSVCLRLDHCTLMGTQGMWAHKGPSTLENISTWPASGLCIIALWNHWKLSQTWSAFPGVWTVTACPLQGSLFIPQAIFWWFHASAKYLPFLVAWMPLSIVTPFWKEHQVALAAVILTACQIRLVQALRWDLEWWTMSPFFLPLLSAQCYPPSVGGITPLVPKRLPAIKLTQANSVCSQDATSQRGKSYKRCCKNSDKWVAKI